MPRSCSKRRSGPPGVPRTAHCFFPGDVEGSQALEAVGHRVRRGRVHMRRNLWRRLRGARTTSRIGLGVGVVLVAVATAVAFGLGRPSSIRAVPVPQTTAGAERATPGAKDEAHVAAPLRPGKPPNLEPKPLVPTKAGSAGFDGRKLQSTVLRRGRPAHEGPYSGG